MFKYWLFILAFSVTAARSDDAPAVSGPSDSDEIVLPSPLKEISPVYPSVLAANYIRGEVLVEMDINAKGRVEKARVIQSNNPAFDSPSIKAALASTYKPATRKGVPIPITIKQPIVFTIEGAIDGGSEMFRVKQPKQSKKTGATAPKPTAVVLAVYPHESLLKKQSGKADVQLLLDKKGRVVNVRVVEASSPEFGFAAMAAAEQFSFTPAVIAELPVSGAMTLNVNFDLGGSGDFVQPTNKRLLKIEAQKPDRIVKAHQLDQPLKIISQKAAVFPVSLGTTFSKGEAVVEFLIDEKGAVALPRIISADAPAFGYAAVQAVSVWLFEPPVSKGEKVITKARVPFKFQYAASPPSS